MRAWLPVAVIVVLVLGVLTIMGSFLLTRPTNTAEPVGHVGERSEGRR